MTELSHKKYILLANETKDIGNGVIVQRIYYTDKKEKGGWLQSEANLSQDGACGVWDEAIVCDGALVTGDAQIEGEALICGQAVIRERANVWARAVVRGEVVVEGRAEVCGTAVLEGSVHLFGLHSCETADGLIWDGVLGKRRAF